MLLLSLLYFCFITPASTAWIQPQVIRPFRGIFVGNRAVVTTRTVPMKLSRQDSDKESSIRRLSVSGVSVSKDGFWLFLKVPPDSKGDNVRTLPLQVTSNPLDAAAATSAEALTLLQLISGVDMAGPILPPEVLVRMTVLFCEGFERAFEDVEPEEAAGRTKLLEIIQKNLPDNFPRTYSECNVWQRSKVRLPKISLNQARLWKSPNEEGWVLECSIPEVGKLTVCPPQSIVEQVSYEFDEKTSANFISLALALRYKAPIVLGDSDESFDLLDDASLQKRFPLFKTVESLKDQSSRVQQNIERGFEIQKLTGALKIAMEKGDESAAKIIREKLDQYDSLDDLPTLPDDFGIDQMQ